MMSPEERYCRDPQFKTLVDTVEMMIHRCEYTPTELREAVILAAIRHESRTVKVNSYLARRIHESEEKSKG